MKPKSVRGELLILLTTLCWSTTGLFCVALDGLHPLLIHGVRSLIGALILLCYARFKITVNRTVLLGAFCIFATTVGYMCAQDLTSPANAVVLQYSAPIFVLLETCLFYRRRPTLTQLAVVALAVGGIVVLFASELTPAGLLGSLLGVLSGVAFSGVFFINRMKNARPLDSLILGFLGGAAVGLLFVRQAAAMTPRQWLVMCAMGALNVGLAYIFFTEGIKTCSSFNASIIGTLEVILLPLWIFLLYRQTPALTSVIGGIMVVSAVVINTVRENQLRKHGASVVG